MNKLLQKKANNHGFTLAELLVVIAILAILIAIAIPVFSGMVAEANLRVNQANVRTVRSAGVSHILTHLDANDEDGDQQLNEGLQADHGWAAIAEVDNNGDITGLMVFVLTDASAYRNGISPTALTTPSNVTAENSTAFYVLSDKITSNFATVKPSTGGEDTDNHYWVQAIITDLDSED